MFSKYSKNVASVIGSCLYVLCGFFAAQLAVIITLRWFIDLKILQPHDLEKPLSQMLVLAAAYSLALLLIVLLPRAFAGSHRENIKKILGIAKNPCVKDFGLSLLGFGAYLVLTIIFGIVVQSIWNGFDADQTQPVGFQGIKYNYEFVLAFIALVVVPPIVEELLFRGYLFGKLRAKSGFWLSAIITSVLFGLVHLQWNVGVDVFALSLVLCYLRERTGTVWAGIALHMIKNGMAFFLLFLHPDLLKGLL